MAEKLPLDPLLGILPRHLRNSPAAAACGYCALSLITTLLASSCEGLFIHGSVVTWNNKSYAIHPLISNFSTLLDFALLNPLLIFYLLKAQEARLKILTHPSHKFSYRVSWVRSAACMVIAVAMMSAYYFGFLQGNYFDAIVALSSDGSRLITVAGWAVFFWTTLSLYITLVGVTNQTINARDVLTRTRGHLIPLYHEDNSPGLSYLAEPGLFFLKAMASLLAIFIVFVIYDYFVFSVRDSHRVLALGPYVVVVFPLFLAPILRFHRLMKGRRSEILASLLTHRAEMLGLSCQKDDCCEGARRGMGRT